MKSKPAEGLSSIHGNILSQYPVWRVAPGRFVDPSAWTSGTQTGGDRVAVEKSKSGVRPPLHPWDTQRSNRFDVLRDELKGNDIDDKEDERNATDVGEEDAKVAKAAAVQSTTKSTRKSEKTRQAPEPRQKLKGRKDAARFGNGQVSDDSGLEQTDEWKGKQNAARFGNGQSFGSYELDNANVNGHLQFGMNGIMA